MKKWRIKIKYTKGILIGIIGICIMGTAIFYMHSQAVSADEELPMVYRIGYKEKDEGHAKAVITAFEAYLRNRGYDEIEVEYHSFNSGTALIDAMNQSTIDIGFVDAYSIAKNDISENLHIVASENSTSYNGTKQSYYRALLLRRIHKGDDELTYRETDYKESTYCVMSPTSIAGYLGVMPFFEEQNLNFYDLKSVRITSFQEGIDNLADDVCDISVGYTNIREDYEDLWELLEGSRGSIYDELQIIYTSEKLYEDAVIVSTSVDESLQNKFLELLEANDYSAANTSDYDYLKESIAHYLGGK